MAHISHVSQTAFIPADDDDEQLVQAVAQVQEPELPQPQPSIPPPMGNIPNIPLFDATGTFMGYFAT
jgi:hypothetical protein